MQPTPIDEADMSMITTSPSHGVTGARVAATLRDAILSGKYAPGERFRQDELADHLGASRVPVREALRTLEAEGLVTIVPNTGAWVSTLSVADCEEMYWMRERLEPLLLRLSAPNLTDDVIDHLTSLAHEMQATDDVERFLALDREFHLTSLQAADTTVLGDTVIRLWNRTQRYRREATRLLSLEGDGAVHHDHHLLVGALRRRDVDEAEHVLTRHIRRSRLELVRHPEVFDP